MRFVDQKILLSARYDAEQGFDSGVEVSQIFASPLWRCHLDDDGSVCLAWCQYQCDGYLFVLWLFVEMSWDWFFDCFSHETWKKKDVCRDILVYISFVIYLTNIHQASSRFFFPNSSVCTCSGENVHKNNTEWKLQSQWFVLRESRNYKKNAKARYSKMKDLIVRSPRSPTLLLFKNTILCILLS